MPKLSGVIETALYVDDLDRARAFYERVLGLEPLTADSRFLAYDVGGRSVLLHRSSNARAPTIAMITPSAMKNVRLLTSAPISVRPRSTN